MYNYELTQLKSPDFPFIIIFDLFIGGIAAGAFLVTVLLLAFGGKINKAGLHRAYYITMALLPVYGLLLILKLEHKERFINVLWQIRDGTIMLNLQSPMSLGAWVMNVFGVFALVGFLYALKKDNLLQFSWAQKLYHLATWLHEGPIAKVFLSIGAFFSAWFGVYLGILVTTSHLPAWNATPFIPTLWMISAVITGVSVVILLLIFTNRSSQLNESIQRLDNIVKSVIVLNIAMIIVFVFALGQWSETVTRGMFGVLLWGGVVGIGLLVPLLLKLKPNLLGLKNSLIFSSVLVLVGGFILRYVVMMGPMSYW
ncbi:formate-dependent nitrite reductase membrane component NrfD [Evansella vedderi]|uniref:Formate-dependent nitrite reductase membrane component NrfD n=1 Tax=Evansella vedderi TaxID=38282 RepID=A0ABT9ZPJ6_9BACI|nr:NrfD/PsrC family molybdoenzyme membrane anchor subunit [Evansella vedderi]MDQ0252875.1 formate-dependent nitrite reductase membrane component NrfD [Evansella vedderi]